MEIIEKAQELGADGHSDFRIDLETIERLWSPKARWLWIVSLSGMGTHLIRLGATEQELSWGRAALRQNRQQAVFVVQGSGERLLQVDLAQAKELLQEPAIRVRAGHVFRHDKMLAEIHVDLKRPTYTQPDYRAVVRFLPLAGLDLDGYISLYYAAIEAAAAEAGTMFVKIEEIFVDSEPLLKRIERLQTLVREEVLA